MGMLGGLLRQGLGVLEAHVAGDGCASPACQLSGLVQLFSLSAPWFSLWGREEDGIGQEQDQLPRHVH